MSATPQQPTKRDVFIVFSKSEPFEAKFALAVKDGLEQLRALRTRVQRLELGRADGSPV